MPSNIDTSYRTWPLADLEALKSSTLIQLKNIEGAGQSFNGAGRSTSQASYSELKNTLASINAALDYIRQRANNGNKGFASRYNSFSNFG